jgi:hypothetical protein
MCFYKNKWLIINGFYTFEMTKYTISNAKNVN